MSFTIGVLSRKMRISVSRIRYYERIGILHSKSRTSGNYRLFDEESAKRLAFIQVCQGAGLSLENILSLIRQRDGTRIYCKQVLRILQQQKDRVELQVNRLNAVLRSLDILIKECATTSNAGLCGEIAQLKTKNGPG